MADNVQQAVARIAEQYPKARPCFCRPGNNPCLPCAQETVVNALATVHALAVLGARVLRVCDASMDAQTATMDAAASCSRGWTRRCGSAKSPAKRCRCRCGGWGHGNRTDPQLALWVRQAAAVERAGLAPSSSGVVA